MGQGCQLCQLGVRCDALEFVVRSKILILFERGRHRAFRLLSCSLDSAVVELSGHGTKTGYWRSRWHGEAHVPCVENGMLELLLLLWSQVAVHRVLREGHIGEGVHLLGLSDIARLEIVRRTLRVGPGLLKIQTGES